MDMYVPDGFRGDDVDPEESERQWERIQKNIKEAVGSLVTEYYCSDCDYRSTVRQCFENCFYNNHSITERISRNDPVNHPPHYTFGKFEVIDVLEDWFPTDPLLWQVGKYISRAGRKGSRAVDLKKARFYLDRAIIQAEVEEAKLA